MKDRLYDVWARTHTLCRDSGHWKDDAYCDAISVDATCEGCEGRYLAFVFHNNGHNVQLLLPMTVNIDVAVPWVRETLEHLWLAPAANHLRDWCPSLPVGNQMHG